MTKSEYIALLQEAEAVKQAAWEANNREAWIEADQEILELGRQYREGWLPLARHTFNPTVGWA
jgi:hypothetical protein